MSSSNSGRSEGGRESQERDHRQEVSNTIIKMLEDGVAPWQKPWEGFGMPYNPTSAKEYRGGNAVNLMASALEQGFTDPRWLTYRQAAENDWQVKKGEQGTRIEYWDVKPPLPRAESERKWIWGGRRQTKIHPQGLYRLQRATDPGPSGS